VTKSLIQLSRELLGKLHGANGKPVSGRLLEPADLSGEIQALKDVKDLQLWRLPNNFTVCQFNFGNLVHIAINFEVLSDDRADLETDTGGTIVVVDVPGSIYLYLAHALDLQVAIKDPQEIEEYVAGPAQSERGVELSIIRKFFHPITVFRIDGRSIFSENLSPQYISYYISTFSNHIKRNNKLSVRSIAIIRQMFYLEKENFLVGNLFEAMTTPIAKHAFLEIYKLLEFVFVLPRAKALLERLQHSAERLEIKILDFARYCNKELGWKRVERDSLSRLFREFGSTQFNSFVRLHRDCAPLHGIPPCESDAALDLKISFYDKIAENYYHMRNQVAHQFWPDEEIFCNDGDWHALIEFTLECVSYLYDHHLGVIHEKQTKTA
jgi:hypothetical protein